MICLIYVFRWLYKIAMYVSLPLPYNCLEKSSGACSVNYHKWCLFVAIKVILQIKLLLWIVQFAGSLSWAPSGCIEISLKMSSSKFVPSMASTPFNVPFTTKDAWLILVFPWSSISNATFLHQMGFPFEEPRTSMCLGNFCPRPFSRFCNASLFINCKKIYDLPYIS